MIILDPDSPTAPDLIDLYQRLHEDLHALENCLLATLHQPSTAAGYREDISQHRRWLRGVADALLGGRPPDRVGQRLLPLVLVSPSIS